LHFRRKWFNKTSSKFLAWSIIASSGQI
jgi:hypothetical protein